MEIGMKRKGKRIRKASKLEEREVEREKRGGGSFDEDQRLMFFVCLSF